MRKNDGGKIENFIESTKTRPPASGLGEQAYLRWEIVLGILRRIQMFLVMKSILLVL